MPRYFLVILLFIFLSISAPFSLLAQESSDSTSFVEGVTNFQSQKFEEAKEKFLKVKEQRPHDAHVLFNLGLTEFHLQNFAHSLAHIRKARFLQPLSWSPYQALNDIEAKLSNQISFHQSSYEDFRRHFLNFIPLNLIWFLFCLLFFFFIRFFIHYFSAKQKAFDLEISPPLFKNRYWIIASLFLLSLLFVSLKTYDFLHPRGTVLNEATTFSAPNESAAQLFKLDLGQEVLLQKNINDWTLIQQLDGLSGWIKKSHIKQHSGMNL